MTYTHCTVTNNETGQKYLAKVGDKGHDTVGPVEILFASKWITEKEFGRTCSNYSCDDYRFETEESPMSTTVTTTKTEQAPYGNPKPASFEFQAVRFGLHIYLHREAILLSRSKAAEKIGINDSALAAIEAGTYHGIDEIAKAAKWAQFTREEMGDFFGLQPAKAKEPEKKRWLPLAIIAFLFLLVTYILVWNL